MTPDWLKEIEERLKQDVEYWTDELGSEQVTVRDQRLFGRLLTNTPKLISALKLAIEGLEKIEAMGFRVNLDIPGAYDFNTTGKIAHEILQKIKRGEERE